VFNIDVADMRAKMKIYFKGTNEKVVLSLAGVVVATITAFSIGACSVFPKNEIIGGVDLAGFCKSLNYSTNDEENDEIFCTSNIDLNRACNWQYTKPDLHIRFDENNDPYSGLCYDPQNNPIGGISDMLGYCKDEYRRSPDVMAEVKNDIWACRTKIDMDLACTWQYQKEDLEARNEEGTWQCYE